MELIDDYFINSYSFEKTSTSIACLTIESAAWHARHSLISHIDEKLTFLECFDSSAANKGLASLRSPLGPVKNDTNSGAKDHDLGSNWESPKGDGISPLRFDSSPKEMYRHKENLHAQLQQSFSASKGSQNSKNNLVASVEKCVTVSHVVKVQHSVMEAKALPSVRANVVTARRVISTRITHQVLNRKKIACVLNRIHTTCRVY